MEEIKQRPLEALRNREVVFHPESQHRFAIDSLENAPDWCISRQLWWGHQLPVWYCPDGHVTVQETEPGGVRRVRLGGAERETDVLDTWFSSALWPFATLGWPDDTEDLRYFYPGDLQTTAREIIRLWENRMIFCGLELLGEVPFRDVIIHSTVLAPDGRRMSKSLGTGIDPLEIIERYGTDATRYGLLKNSLTQDVRFSYSAIEEGAKLSNKLWNAARLIINAARGRRAGRAAVVARGALDPRPAVADAAGGRGLPRRVRLRARDGRALPPDLRRLLRLVPRGGQGPALRRRRRRARDRDRGARAAADAAAPGDAARDRGDLVEPARRAARG